MKEKSFSVASHKANRAEFDVFVFRDAENLLFTLAGFRNFTRIDKRQTDVSFEDFTKFVNGNF